MPKIKELAAGLTALHNNNIVHGDLHWVSKTSLNVHVKKNQQLTFLDHVQLQKNVLVKHNTRSATAPHIMLCDFGMMRIHHPKNKNSMSMNPRASLKEEFSAPELFDEITGREMRPEAPSDVFSFAKTIMAFTEGKEPLPGLLGSEPTIGLSNAFGPKAGKIWDVMLKMTERDPSRRPTMTGPEGVEAQLRALTQTP